MQVFRYPPNEGEPYLLHVLHVVWIQAVGQCDQERFPGPSRKACQEIDFPCPFSLRIVLYMQLIVTVCIVLCYTQFKQSILFPDRVRMCGGRIITF